MDKKLEFHIITVSTYGTGLSGGDRIWIELAKRIRKTYRVYVYLWEEGLAIAKREGLKNVDYVLWPAKTPAKFGFFVNYFVRIAIGISRALRIQLADKPSIIIYSASEFWQDSIPSLILKLRYPRITWIAAWYQTAPNPFRGFAEGQREQKYKFSSFFYWFVQQPIKPLISKFADFVCVNNEEEKKHFPKHNEKGKVIVVLGAVPLEEIRKYQSLITDHRSPIYDAVFQGRFHPQKGVVELIDIWKRVVDKRKDAKLAMIGDGPLRGEVQKRIAYYGLRNNIKLFGYVFDGPKKYSIFSKSKIVVHPAFYDSGGMAAAEAMAFGIPCVGFNLKSYESYYPKGMVKVPIGDMDAFAKKIFFLLENEVRRIEMGKEAIKMIEKNWSWDIRAESFLRSISQV